jgi:hypothetical protein
LKRLAAALEVSGDSFANVARVQHTEVEVKGKKAAAAQAGPKKGKRK